MLRGPVGREQTTVASGLISRSVLSKTAYAGGAASRCPHNTSGHRDDISPAESQLVECVSIQRSGREDLRVVRIARSERVDPLLCSGVPSILA